MRYRQEKVKAKVQKPNKSTFWAHCVKVNILYSDMTVFYEDLRVLIL